MFDLFWPAEAWAQVPAGPAGGAQQRFFAQLLLIVSFVLIMYFLMLRPQMKRQKAAQEMMKNLKNGDQVITTGGIYGQILGLKDDRVVLKIGEETKIEVAKSAIAGLVQK
jgi:preprotein translocase subunit YajC